MSLALQPQPAQRRPGWVRGDAGRTKLQWVAVPGESAGENRASFGKLRVGAGWSSSPNGVGRERGPLHAPRSKGSWRVELPAPLRCGDRDTALLAANRVKDGCVCHRALPGASCPARELGKQRLSWAMAGAGVGSPVSTGVAGPQARL